MKLAAKSLKFPVYARDLISPVFSPPICEKIAGELKIELSYDDINSSGA